MHITIERDGCISCGLCEGTCPSVFRIAEDGLAEVHHQPETAEEQAGAQEPQAAVRWLSFMSAENVSVKADRRVCLLHRPQEFESLPDSPAHIPQIGAFFSQECSVFSAPETLQ